MINTPCPDCDYPGPCWVVVGTENERRDMVDAECPECHSQFAVDLI
jgi:Zn finger protein HypA/HybF involved in hydrogenase expression